LDGFFEADHAVLYEILAIEVGGEAGLVGDALDQAKVGFDEVHTRSFTFDRSLVIPVESRAGIETSLCLAAVLDCLGKVTFVCSGEQGTPTCSR